jgi:hypothetical protein
MACPYVADCIAIADEIRRFAESTHDVAIFSCLG